LNNPQSDAPLFTAPAAGQEIQYRVSGTTDAGCQGEGFASIKVYAGPELYVPNAFTPNGDGRNDLFFPFPVGVKSLDYFQVYNRWGQLLFSTRTLGEGWDGRNAGNDQPAGVYIWQLRAVMEGDVEVKRQGTVVLIR
jgi:gliding motility-associated-like protein